MNDIDQAIINSSNVICKNIDKFNSSERGILSQNILAQLRTFVETIFLKIYSDGKNLEINYDNIPKAIAYIKTQGKLKFLNNFHELLQMSKSHYIWSDEISERLMLKYYEYLLKIRNYLKEVYNMQVLDNIEKFPININSDLQEYYSKIVDKINKSNNSANGNIYNERYYIKKKKAFFVDNKIYYEITFTIANDVVSKFDRIIAFTKIDISTNYAVKFKIREDKIELMNQEVPILIIDKWKVSIRPCEINNLAKVFGVGTRVQGRNREYRNLMRLLTNTGLNLLDIVQFNNCDYCKIKDIVTKDISTIQIFAVLDYCREIIINNKDGCNIIRYFLYRLNNKVIKSQYCYRGCDKLSGLYFWYGCIPFDKMPFFFSLINHNPSIYDLLSCINYKDREEEFLARAVKNNTEIRCMIYTPLKELDRFNNIDKLMESFNSKLYKTHNNRKLEKYKDNIFINGYEQDCSDIIINLKELSKSGIDNYTNSFDSWLSNTSYNIDSNEKRLVLRKAFEKSKVFLVYGSAGTGKTTLINHLSNFFSDKKKLYLAKTNPAVENLKRRITISNSRFSTIDKFFSKQNEDRKTDILFIDECSTVSNSDIIKILNEISFEILILVGDIYQIESIIFGNWFTMAYSLMPKNSKCELTEPHRTDNKKLLELWKKVRNIDYDILEYLTRNNYSKKLDESIFYDSNYDQIILCLNYDGLYGINNINNFLQSNNRNIAVQWGTATYKVGDPILFNEVKRFNPLIYNNMKGTIVKIEKYDDRIQFDIEIDKVLNELDINNYDLDLVGYTQKGNSIIRFSVNKYNSTDYDDDLSSESVVPFQVAYAVSIHKAQGLEYESVKVIITEEAEESISHNILYTAITRAKKDLTIYWSPETENKVLGSLEHKVNHKDRELISNKYNLKKK